MNTINNWIIKRLAPIMNKITESPWVVGLQKAKLMTLPMVMVGTIVSVYLVLDNYLGRLPDLEPVRTYTFGLISLFMVFLIPFYILEEKNNRKIAFVAGCTGLSLYMLLVNPTIAPTGYIYNFEKFGTGGMFVSIVAGLFTSMSFLYFSKIEVFKNVKLIPPIMKESINSILPIAFTVMVGWFVVIEMEFDLYEYIVNLLMPLMGIAQTLPGVILLTLLPTILYSMGISNWVFQPIVVPVVMAAISANATQDANNIFTNETIIAFFNLGGKGATLGLAFLFLTSKKKRIKALGYATVVPSLMNINDPLVFSAIAWNPVLMVPMWINTIVLPFITYIFMSIKIVPIPNISFNMWYMPVGVSAWLITNSIMAVLLVVVNLLVSTLIWYPFFKIYEKSEETSLVVVENSENKQST